MFGKFSLELFFTGGIVAVVVCFLLVAMWVNLGWIFTTTCVVVFFIGSTIFTVDWGWIKAWIQTQIDR